MLIDQVGSRADRRVSQDAILKLSQPATHQGRAVHSVSDPDSLMKIRAIRKMKMMVTGSR